MHLMTLKRTFLSALVLVGLSSASAAPILVGTGTNQANLVINFSSGAIYQYEVLFDAIDWTGEDLLGHVVDETALEWEVQVFSFGTLLDGLSIDDHSDVGFGGGNNWWQYWVRESADDPWQQAATGFSDRTVSDGAWDGWVYGSASPPMLIPEPGVGALILLGFAVLGVRRRFSA